MAFLAETAGRGGWAGNAVDTLAAHFDRAHNTLLLVQQRLEDEMSDVYGQEVNPMTLLLRVKKLQEQLIPLELECKKLLAAKQEFMTKTATTLVNNKKTLQRFLATVNPPPQDPYDEDSTFNALQTIIVEWKKHYC